VARFSKVTGIKTVLSNLTKEIIKIRGRSMAGLVRGVIVIRRDMDRTPPLIPVDLGNLRTSWFVVPGIGKGFTKSAKFKGPQAGKLSAGHGKVITSNNSQVKGREVVGFGFSAFYSGVVHESVGTKNWSRTGSGPKFLEASIKRNKAAILAVILAQARIKR